MRAKLNGVVIPLPTPFTLRLTSQTGSVVVDGNLSNVSEALLELHPPDLVDLTERMVEENREYFQLEESRIECERCEQCGANAAAGQRFPQGLGKN